MTNPKSVELKACPLCNGDELSHGYVAAGGMEWGTAGCEVCDLQVTKGTEAEAITAWNTRPQSEPIPQAEMVEHLKAILAAQAVDPYQGWNITKLNKAADDARAALGLPSVRDLNPDIAKMQDHAAANKDAILAALHPTPEASSQGEVIFTPEAIEAASMEVSRLQNSLDITNADHIALWLEANMVESPLAWLACRIVEAHEAAIAKVLANPPRHVFWGAGEPDCPRDLKAGNGELHTLRCKVCGEENLRNDICLVTLQHPHKPDTRGEEIARLRGILAGFRRSLTNGERNRDNQLSVNHDELRALISETRNALSTPEER